MLANKGDYVFKFASLICFTDADYYDFRLALLVFFLDTDCTDDTDQFKSEKSVSKTILNDTQYHEEIILKNHSNLRPKKNLSDTQCHKETKNHSHKQGKHLNYV